MLRLIDCPDVLSGVRVRSTSRRIGFRVFHLITSRVDESTLTSLTNATGSDNWTMRFKVNGADMYSRGANVIPMDEMEGRLSAAAYQQLVRSAAAAGMNTFRIWGGGIYLHDVFYDTAGAAARTRP